MSLSGDLEHLPLIDVIQLLQQTSKSGTLRLTGAKGWTRIAALADAVDRLLADPALLASDTLALKVTGRQLI